MKKNKKMANEGCGQAGGDRKVWQKVWHATQVIPHFCGVLHCLVLLLSLLQQCLVNLADLVAVENDVHLFCINCFRLKEDL